MSGWAFMQRYDVPDYDDWTVDYMTRWRVFGTPWCGFYIHRINRPDPRRTLHDHPWPFLSFVLRGGYVERFGLRAKGDRIGPIREVMRRTRRWGSVRFMRKTDAHAIVELRRSPTWTLVFVGRRRPEPSWGYWADPGSGGFTPFDEHPHAAEVEEAVAGRLRGDEPPKPFAKMLDDVAGRISTAPPGHFDRPEVRKAAERIDWWVRAQLGLSVEPARVPADRHSATDAGDES